MQQYLRVSNDNLRSTIAETQVGDASHALIGLTGAGVGEMVEESRSAASKQVANLNASLGRILNQSSMMHVSAI